MPPPLRVPENLTALFPEILAGPPQEVGIDDEDARHYLLSA
jgi:hypothetical protein